MDDNSVITWGDHKGKKLEEIPDGWFIFLYDRGKLKGALLKYACDRIPILKFTEERKKKV